MHHCQLLQSIHDLHKSDKPFAQELMNNVLSGSVELKIKTKNERKQRWLVNQQNATQTLEMYHTITPEGNSALVEWALKFVNESTSDWKRRAGQEIATWLSMPSIILGLHFESELGNYFEEIYAWHCRSGGLNKRSGFRMMEIYDVWLGFEVPWWNKAIKNPELQLPKTMKYLDDNFEGEEHAFRKSQIMRGLNAGRDEMMKMSKRYLLRPPIMYLLLTHSDYGSAFLRAVLAILAENPTGNTVLIQDANSSEWGQYLYEDPSDRPADVKKWYDVLCQHPEEVVHFWRQFRLDADCVVKELKTLTKQTCARPVKDDCAPILSFKKDYPVLFECLDAVFGLMMSNSRLCEQMHGALRHGLRSQQGMDEVDARRSYEVVNGYLFKQERRHAYLSVRKAKRQKVSRKHNNTKTQITMVSDQLTEYLPKWLKQAKELLQQPNHRVPTLSDIKAMGRREQDKNNVAIQMRAHNEKAASLRRQKLSVDAIKQRAIDIIPSNDNILRMGQERLQSRERIRELIVQRFWKELEDGGKVLGFKALWMSAVKSFPRILRFNRTTNSGPPQSIITSRASAMKVIGKYLTAAKKTTKLICDFCFGSSNCQDTNFVPKRERNFEQSDLLEWMDFAIIVDLSDATNAIVESTASACLSTFQSVDDHYTYTLSDDGDDDDDDLTASDDAHTQIIDITDADVNEAQSHVDSSNTLRRSSRRRRPRNRRRMYPGEQWSSEEEQGDEEEDAGASVPFE